MCENCHNKYSQEEIRRAKLCRICLDYCLDGKVKLNEDRLCIRCERDIKLGKTIRKEVSLSGVPNGATIRISSILKTYRIYAHIKQKGNNERTGLQHEGEYEDEIAIRDKSLLEKKRLLQFYDSVRMTIVKVDENDREIPI